MYLAIPIFPRARPLLWTDYGQWDCLVSDLTCAYKAGWLENIRALHLPSLIGLAQDMMELHPRYWWRDPLSAPSPLLLDQYWPCRDRDTTLSKHVGVPSFITILFFPLTSDDYSTKQFRQLSQDTLKESFLRIPWNFRDEMLFHCLGNYMRVIPILAESTNRRAVGKTGSGAEGNRW